MPKFTPLEDEIIKAELSKGSTSTIIASLLPKRSRGSIVGRIGRMQGEWGLRLNPAHKSSAKRTNRKPRRKQKAKPEAKIVPLPDLNAPKPLNLPLIDLNNRQCKYAVNEAEYGETHLFCGHTIRDHSQSYCDYHKAKCKRPKIRLSERGEAA